MNKKVVIYQSKYGTTKKYAQWIAEELSCDLFERKTIKPSDLMKYDTIIYGGGLYAGGVLGIDLLVKAFESIKDKNIVLFTCGLADPKDPQNVNHIRASLAKVFCSEMREKITVFHVRGGIDYQKLSIIHKSMMALLYKLISKKDDSTLRAEDKHMLETYGKTVDFTDKNSINPILDFIRFKQSVSN